jgi:hypothetical protein
MKRIIECDLVNFKLEENLLNETCIFANMGGNSLNNVCTKEKAEKAVKKLEAAIPILKKWINLVGTKK